jgi:hypothetical protein
MGSRRFGELRGFCVKLQGKFNAEAGASRRTIFYANRAAVLRDDAVTNTQTEARALPDWLGGVEGIEDP